MNLLQEVVGISNLSDSVKLFSQVPSNSPIARYVNEMKTKFGLSRLANRIVRWFNETKSDGKPFDYRKRKPFDYLIAAVEPFQKQGSRE